jgi:hypothetical protein
MILYINVLFITNFKLTIEIILYIDDFFGAANSDPWFLSNFFFWVKSTYINVLLIDVSFTWSLI